MPVRRLLVSAALVLVACGGAAERPAAAAWAPGASTAIDSIQAGVDGLTGIYDLIPGDYIPRRMLRTCFELAASEAGWADLLMPAPTPEADTLAVSVLDGIEAVCLDLHDADLVAARPRLLAVAADLQELRLATSGLPDR